VDSLTLESRQVCVYLVGRLSWDILSNSLTNLSSSLNIRSTRSAFLSLSSRLEPRVRNQPGDLSDFIVSGPVAGRTPRHRLVYQVGTRLLSVVAGKYTGLYPIAATSLLTSLPARVPIHRVPLSIFHLPRLPSASGEAVIRSSGHTTRHPVDSRVRKRYRDLW